MPKKEVSQILEELIAAIESGAIDNKSHINDVKLWAESWREEVRLFSEQPNDQYPDNDADGYVFCGKCGKMK